MDTQYVQKFPATASNKRIQWVKDPPIAEVDVQSHTNKRLVHLFFSPGTAGGLVVRELPL